MSKPKSRGNGTGSVYRLPSGKYRAAVTLGYHMDGRRVYKTKSGFKTKREALDYLAVLKDAPQMVKDMRFGKLYEEWSALHYRNIGKNKQTAYRAAYRRCAAIQFMNVSDLRTKDFQGVIDACEGGYWVKHDIKLVCNMMMEHAMKNDYVLKNYVQYVTLPPAPKGTRDAFTENEVAALWADYEGGQSFTGYILIMVYTGMRLGELQLIKKEDVLLDRHYIIGGIKTDAGKNRRMMLPDKIMPIVESFYGANEKKLLEMDGKIFYQQYYETLERIGARRLSPHCCRHTFATRMAELGIAPAVIKEMAGHRNYSTTLQYTHISDEEKMNAANKLN